MCSFDLGANLKRHGYRESSICNPAMDCAPRQPMGDGQLSSKGELQFGNLVRNGKRSRPIRRAQSSAEGHAAAHVCPKLPGNRPLAARRYRPAPLIWFARRSMANENAARARSVFQSSAARWISGINFLAVCRSKARMRGSVSGNTPESAADSNTSPLRTNTSGITVIPFAANSAFAACETQSGTHSTISLACTWRIVAAVTCIGACRTSTSDAHFNSSAL